MTIIIDLSDEDLKIILLKIVSGRKYCILHVKGPSP